MHNKTKEQRAVRDADFESRMQPRVLWDSNNGTAVRTHRGYAPQPVIKKRVTRLTEAEDNARARAERRRQHRFSRGWLPHAKR